MLKVTLFALLFILGHNIAQAQSKTLNNLWKDPEKVATQEKAFDRFADSFTGCFERVETLEDGTIQHAFLVQIIVWSSGDSRWIYSEQFLKSAPRKPISQQFYKISKLEDNSFEMVAYAAKTPEGHINEWRKETPFDRKNTDHVVDKENETGCTFKFTEKKGKFISVPTMEITCQPPHQLHENVVYAQYRFDIEPNMLKINGTFYNEDKNVEHSFRDAGFHRSSKKELKKWP